MSQRFRPTDAFVDESIRGQRYLMGCILVEARSLPFVRPVVESLALHGGRVHFHNESARRRRLILGAFAELPVEAMVVIAQRRHGVTLFDARERCVSWIVGVVQSRAVPRLVIESRHDDSEDERTIRRARRSEPHMVFEHRLAAEEAMLWIADGVTWAVGAGAAWSALIEPILTSVVEIQP